MINREKIKQTAKQVLSLDSHPGHIAAGFSVGVFISFTPPIPGLHTGLALAVAFLFRLNKLTCLAGAWVNSPLTIIPALIFNYKLGAMILGCRSTELHLRGLDWPHLKVIMTHHAKPLLLGCSLTGFVAALISYFVCYRLVVLTRRKDVALAELTREMEEVGEELK
ncbi:MAG: DUF2062 domain-containing protein [Desulfuromonadales bacterium]|nr:DUF2062 domain-containing protein [Desulfuromonadales bacterium]